MDDHVTEVPPKDDKKKGWLRDDAWLYLQIKNSIDSEVVGLVDHCDSVKKLLEFLVFLYYGKGRPLNVWGLYAIFFLPNKK